MKKIIVSFILVCLYANLFSQTDPIIITILDSQPVSGITNIQYEFSGTYLSYDIAVEVSFDDNPYQPVPESDLSGDLNNVAPGVRNIVWNGAASFPNYYHLQTLIRITATPDFTCGDQITDIDGNVYNTVLIGTQCWMKENLKTTRDANGNAITRYCYNDDPSNCEVYGGLYTWATVMNGAASSNTVPSGVQGICPSGWHVASDAEWDILVNHLGGASVAGGKIKEAGFERWNSPNEGATNESGFTALPGGLSFSNGFFGYVGLYGWWWTSSEIGSDYAWSRGLGYDHQEVRWYDTFGKVWGLSDRCLRDN